MTVTNSMLMHYMAEADRQKRADDRSPQVYDMDPMITGLRAFVRYNKDRLEPYEFNGRVRALTHKQVAMAGLVARIATTQERATITGMAKEVGVVPSTVSRFLLKLQAWGAYAVDVTRGRHGGVRVRLRSLRDGLQAYAHRAWAKVSEAAARAFSRSRGNVASVPSLEESTYNTADNDLVSTYLLMDATFSEAWDAAERNGAPVLAEQDRPDPSPASPGQVRRVDPQEFAAAVYAERRRLAIIDPAGEAEAVRPLWN